MIYYDFTLLMEHKENLSIVRLPLYAMCREELWKKEKIKKLNRINDKRPWGHKKREMQTMNSLQMTFQFLFLLPHELYFCLWGWKKEVHLYNDPLFTVLMCFYCIPNQHPPLKHWIYSLYLNLCFIPSYSTMALFILNLL